MDEILVVLRALGDAAGWVVAVIVLGLVGYGFAKGVLVPGYVYKREVTRGDRAEDAVEAAAESTKQAAIATKAATDTALAVSSQLASFSLGVREARDEPR